jgi:hypothetical protein
MLLCAFGIIARVSAAGFRGQVAGVFEQAAAATDRDGRETRASSMVISGSNQIFNNFTTAISISQILEAAVLVLEAFAFLLFFPACIVMFRRVERRLETFIQEMSLRSDLGNVFLPFEFSPPAADGSEAQVELPIVEARQFLQTMKSSATAQRRRFLFCLLFVLMTLVALASHAVFSVYFTVRNNGANFACLLCGSCQSIEWLISVWYVFTPELFALVISLSSTLPLVFALWLMTTPEDRALLLRPDRFRTLAIALVPTATESDARQRAERVRMGINLK